MATAAAAAARRLLRRHRRLLSQNQLGPQSAERAWVNHSALREHLTDPSSLLTNKQVIPIRSMSCGVYGKATKAQESIRPLKTCGCGRWQSMASHSRPNQASRRTYCTGTDPTHQQPHTWSDPSQGPPPISQLTYYSAYDFKLGGWIEPATYFKVNGMTYSIPQKRLIRKQDGDFYLLLDNTKTFLRSILLLAYNNVLRGYCIAPSFTEDNLAISYNSATCAIVTVRFYKIGEVVGGKEITAATSYRAAFDAFIQLVKKTEGEDRVKNLNPSIKDLDEMIRELEETTDTIAAKKLQKVIIDHPCMLNAAGAVNLIRGADMLLRRVYQFGDNPAKKQLANQILESLPYLGSPGWKTPADEDHWTVIATGHKLLACWYKFSNNEERHLEALIRLGHAIRCMHLNTKHAPRSSNTPIDYKVQMQLKKNRQESGKQLVALNRDGVTHGFDSHVKDAFSKVYDDGTTMPKWPYTIKEIVDVLEINLPKYLPTLVRLLIKFIEDFDLGKFCCWPRDGNCDCLAVQLNTVSNGQHAKLLKFGYTKLVLRLITKKMKAATNPRRQVLKVR